MAASARGEPVYRGAWGEDGRIAYLDTPAGPRALMTSWESLLRIEWGTDPARSRALAHAILCNATGNSEMADELAGSFSVVLARFPSHGFAMSRGEVLDWIGCERRETGNGARADENGWHRL